MGPGTDPAGWEPVGKPGWKLEATSRHFKGNQAVKSQAVKSPGAR